MGFFGKSKKKEATTPIPTPTASRYAPPEINEVDDSSDEEMVVLDFSELVDQEALASPIYQDNEEISASTIEANTGLFTEHPNDDSSNILAPSSPSSNAAEQDIAPSQDSDKKEHPYHGSEMEAEATPEDNDLSKKKQLEQLRARAEDGPLFVRYLCIASMIGMYVTSFISLCAQYLSEGLDWSTVSHCITTCSTWIMGFVVVICEIRSPDPKAFSTTTRLIITKYLSFMRLLWGRGLFYIGLGLLHASHVSLMTAISGSILALAGLVAFFVGRGPAREIQVLRHHEMDEAMLFIDFRRFDYDQDGFLDFDGFVAIISELDLEMDTYHTIREFNSIDSNRDGKIAFSEFKKWKKEEAWSYEHSGCGPFCGVDA